MERKPAAVLEIFFNRGLVGAGLTLVGSHAYGALLERVRSRQERRRHRPRTMGIWFYGKLAS